MSETIIQIDGAECSNDEIAIWGWAAGPDEIKEIKVFSYIDNSELGSVLHGIKRLDVENARPNLNHTLESGFFLYSSKQVENNHPAYIKVITINNEVSISNFRFQHTDLLLFKLKNPLRYNTYMALDDSKFKLKAAERERELAEFKYTPKISIIVPVYNIGPRWLDACVDSVLDQGYENWELILYDDCSTENKTKRCLARWSEKDDPRIKVFFGDTNVNISLASNAAISKSTGEFIAFLDHDDELKKGALFEVIKVLNREKDVDLIYSDEDKIEKDGTRNGPYFKSDFDLDLLRSNNYICHFVVVRKSIGDQVEWLRKGYEGSQDHDFLLRVTDVTKKVIHIPKILYHWRKIESSTASGMSTKSYAVDAGIQALKDHMVRNGIEGDVFRGTWGGAYRIKRKILDYKKVSIIIPFKDKSGLLKTCVDSIFEKTHYPNYEIHLIDNNSGQDRTKEFLNKIEQERENVFVHLYEKEFNYSAINNWAVDNVDSEYILLLNNDVRVINEGWLDNMVEHIQREEVGAVGAKLAYGNNTVQHAGVIIGINDRAGHAFKGFPFWESHYFNMNLIKQYSACTAACLLTKKSVFYEVGGLDAENLKVSFNDVDYCLKLREKQYKIIFTPYSELYHYESKSRGYEDQSEEVRQREEKEASFLIKKWDIPNFNDPFYNPNLTSTLQNNSIRLDLTDNIF